MRLPVGAFQPIAAKDVATAVSGATISDATNGITNIAGPEKRGMDDFVRAALAASNDPRQVVGDPAARYFGTTLDEHTIVPLDSEDPTSRLTCLGRVSVLDRVELQVRGWFERDGVAASSREREIRTRLGAQAVQAPKVLGRAGSVRHKHRDVIDDHRARGLPSGYEPSFPFLMKGSIIPAG